jgi:hypothetical protein
MFDWSNVVYRKCMHWLDMAAILKRKGAMFNESHVWALDILEGAECKIEDINAALLHPSVTSHPMYDEAGRFLSAAYNLSNEKVVIYDLDLPDQPRIGLYFGNKNNEFGRVLINRGTAGHNFAESASGFIVNEGSATSIVAQNNIIINTGHISHLPRAVTIINAGKIERSMLPATTIVDLSNGKYITQGLAHVLTDALRSYATGIITCAQQTPELLGERYIHRQEITNEIKTLGGVR